MPPSTAMPPAKGKTPPSQGAKPPTDGRRTSCPKLHFSHPRMLPTLPSPSGTGRPSPAKTVPPAGLPNLRNRMPGESHGQELDSRETAIAPDRDPPEGEEDEVDVLTRDFWPWMKGKWDDINYAINWYKRNRGEWTRQLKNARAARAAEDRKQAEPEGQADKHGSEYERRRDEPDRIPVWDGNIQPDPDARSLWSAVLGELQLNLPRSTFEAWLKPTAGVAFQGDQFIVVAQTPFAVEWLERRMFHTLQSTLERVAGRRLQLQLEAHNGDDPLVGDDDQEDPSGPDYKPPDYKPGSENDG